MEKKNNNLARLYVAVTVFLSMHSGSESDLGSGSGSGITCVNSMQDHQQVISLYENLAPPISILTFEPLFKNISNNRVNWPESANVQLYVKRTNTSNITIFSNTSFNYSNSAELNLIYIEESIIGESFCMNVMIIVLEDIPPNCTIHYMFPCYTGDGVADFQCNSTNHPQLGNVTYSVTDPHYEIKTIIIATQPIMAGNHSFTLKACSGGIIPKCANYAIMFTLPKLLYFPNETYHINIDDILQENALVSNDTLMCTEHPMCNDSKDIVQYKSFNDSGPFSVFENGSVYVRSRIDYSSENIYNLSVTCNNSLSEDDVIVSISNRKFEFSNATYFVTLPENVSSGEVFLNVTLSWYPTLATITYSISDNLFTISSTGGVSVSSTQSLDHETSRHLNVTVNASAMYAEATATIVINVTDVNDNRPMFNTMSLLEKNVSISEPLGSILLNISAVDNDSGINQEVTYSIEHNDVVDINSSNGSVYVNTSNLECYEGMSYVLLVTVSDSGSPSLSHTINITVTIESLAILFKPPSFMFNITENTAISTVVGYINASVYTTVDGNIGGGLLSFSASSEYFYIDSLNGTLYTSSIIDRELMSRYNFNITASVRCPNVVTMNESHISILVIDENDNRPAFNMFFTNLTINQDVSPASVLYTAVAVDNKDVGRNSEISKYYISRSFNDLFRIDNISGNISISEVPSEYRDYLFDVFAEDNGIPSQTSYPLTLLVSGLVRSDVKNIHFEKDLYIFSVEENTSISTPIGKVKLVYSQNPGPILFTCFNCDNFTINSTSMEIYSKVSHDREQLSSHTFSVTALVGNFRIAQTTVLVIITDINDNIPMFSHAIYTRAVSNAVTTGTPVLTVSASDSDINENSDICYSLHPNNTVFGINTDGSIVTRYTKLDSHFCNFYVVATDKGISQQLSSSAQVRITVFNQIEDFPFNSSSYHFSIAENSVTGSTVGSISMHPNFTYRLVHNSSDSRNCFNLTNGTIFITCDTDREMIDFYYFQIEALSSSINSTANILINVTDRNDNPPVFEYSTYSTAISRSLPPSTVIATFRAFDADYNSTVYYYHSGPETYFKVNRSTGEMTFNEANIGELRGSYSSSVVASDGMLNSTVQYTIFIPYFNEEPLEFDQSQYMFNLTENSDVLTKLGTLVLRYRNDPINETNIIAPLSFEIVDVNNESSNLDFYVSQVGELVTLAKIDRETKSFYNFTVASYYGSTFKLIAETSVLINIQDINDVVPHFNQSIYLLDVNNTIQNGETLLKVIASDNDYQENGTITYTIRNTLYLSSDRANINRNLTSFAINETSGVISLQSPYHPAGQYQLTVVASDNSTATPLTSTALVLINIFDASPENISFAKQMYNFSIPENVSLLTHIGNVSVEEMDHPGLQGIHYNITGGNGSNAFFIYPFSGIITNTVSLDRETNSYYTLQVTATALGVFGIEPSITEVSISVEDTNDEIPLFSEQVYNVRRSSIESNPTIITALATDRDIGDNAELTYTIVSGGNDNFMINNTTGVIYTNSNAIPAGIYPLKISATDHGLMAHTSTALVMITIYYIPPTNISFSKLRYTFNITENSQLLTTVGNVSIHQMDHPGIKGIKYTITGGDGNESFIISPTGTISNIVITDRETVPNYRLTIEAAVIDMPNIEAVSTEVIIYVDDVNDETPVFNDSMYRVNYNENVTVHSSITIVSAHDEDTGNNSTITYRISNSNHPFQINRTTGEIQNTVSLILESSYILYVEAIDQGTPPNTGTATVLVYVTLPEIASLSFPQELYMSNVSEATSPGTSLGHIMVNRHYGFPIENVVYSINSTVFAVDSNQGEIYTREELDYEDITQYSVMLTAVLQVGNAILNASTLVMVDVTDENDNTPFFMNLPNTTAVYEGSANGTEVFQIEARDDDSGQFGMISFSVTNDYDHFTIKNGMVIVNGDIDRERKHQYVLLITAEDGGGSMVDAFLTINILDINDNSPVLLTSNEECFVHERIENSSACTLIFSDPDLKENGSIRVTAITGREFEYLPIPHDNRYRIFTLLVVSALDYEATNSINVTVQFEDMGVIPNTKNKPLIIQVIDEPDNVPVFVNGSSQQVEMRTIVTNGSRIFTISATDVDNDLITYNIVKVDPTDVAKRFYITPFTGVVIIVALEPDFISNSFVNLTISATDNSVYNLSSQANVSVNVIPNTLSFTEVTYEFSLAEEMSSGTTVGVIQIDRSSQATDIELNISSIGPSNVPFHIIPNDDESDRVLTGTIITTEIIDRDNEQNDQFVFSVTAQRTAIQETATATVVVNIQDINDNGPKYNGTTQFSINENTVLQTEIATISAADRDLGENGTIAGYILNNNPNFTIDNNGVLRSSIMFDYETQKTYEVSIQIIDGGQPPKRTNYVLTVEVINLNDNLPMFNYDTYFVDIKEGEAANHFLLNVIVEDKDIDQYSIQGSPLVNALAGAPPLRLIVDDRNSVGNSYRIILSSIPQVIQTGVYSFQIQATDRDNVATATLYVGVFTQPYFFQFTLDNIPEIAAIIDRVITLIENSLFTVYGARSSGLNVYLYGIELTNDGRRTM